MMKQQRKKLLWDIGTLFISGFLVFSRYYEKRIPIEKDFITMVAILLFVFASFDCIAVLLQGKRAKKKQTNVIKRPYEIRQVLLLDEEERPIRCWEVAGKVALIIGKKNKEEEVDINLEECEYSALVEEQHAALNYCAGSWYLEDLSLQNGVKIKKVEDGVCYKVQNRPCKLTAGDIIYIANTKLLLS